MLKMIVCDWNRTLFEDYYEETFFRALFSYVILYSLKRGKVVKIIELVCTLRYVKSLFNKAKEIKSEESSRLKNIAKLIELLNTKLIYGVPLEVFDACLRGYTKKAVSKLDREVLDPLMLIREKYNTKLGIISSGYKEGIRLVLEKQGYTFDFIIANDFKEENGRLICLGQEVLTNKLKFLQKMTEQFNMSMSEVMYIGDDWLDRESFAHIGCPVVSRLAKEKYKNLFREEFQAFVIEGQSAFKLFLENIYLN